MVNIEGQILYRGSASEDVRPTFGLGDDHHDYGRGFYLTDDESLAREWAVCRPEVRNGWVHAYRLDDPDLSVLDFQQSRSDGLVGRGVLVKSASGGRSTSYGLAPFPTVR